jgi:hypothetical protein
MTACGIGDIGLLATSVAGGHVGVGVILIPVAASAGRLILVTRRLAAAPPSRRATLMRRSNRRHARHVTGAPAAAGSTQ